MKSKLSTLAVSLTLALSGLTFVGHVSAEEAKMVGPITKITLATDGKSAIAILKNLKTGAPVSVTVTDDLTLDKFKDKRIVEGDEIRARFDVDGKNTAKSFKKTAGC